MRRRESTAIAMGLVRILRFLLPPILGCQSEEEAEPATPSPSPTQIVGESATPSSASPSPADPAATPAIDGLETAMRHLEMLTRAKPQEQQVASVQEVEWTDGCLDLSEPELCSLPFGPGPGRKITLSTGGREYLYDKVVPGAEDRADRVGWQLPRTEDPAALGFSLRRRGLTSPPGGHPAGALPGGGAACAGHAASMQRMATASRRKRLELGAALRNRSAAGNLADGFGRYRWGRGRWRAALHP